ncbi:MAG: polysaccharide biosynthesis/export family protein [Planctomycetota bacterium]
MASRKSVSTRCTAITLFVLLPISVLAQDAIALPSDQANLDGESISISITSSYSMMMNEASRISSKLKALEQDSDRHKELKQKLAESLEQAFDLRQKLQRQKIATARKQLDLVQKRIDEREKFRAEIIRRKLEDLLTGQSLQWPAEEETPTTTKKFDDQIRSGDVIACVIEGVLPGTSAGQPSSPPVTRLDSGRIVTGFPLTVASDGTLSLPLIGSVHVEGLTIRQAESRISETYVERNILKRERATTMLTLVRQDDARRRDPAYTR